MLLAKLKLENYFIASSTATVCPKNALSYAVYFSNVYYGCIAYGSIRRFSGNFQGIYLIRFSRQETTNYTYLQFPLVYLNTENSQLEAIQG